MLLELVKYVLPEEIVAHFSVVKIEEELYKASVILHIYLEEANTIPEEYQGIELSPNGFYPASTIKDFPLRELESSLAYLSSQMEGFVWQKLFRSLGFNSRGDTLFERIRLFFKRGIWIPAR
jgi:hypothetical protein